MTRPKKMRRYYKWTDPVKNPPKHTRQVLVHVSRLEGFVVLVYNQETKIWRAPINSKTEYKSTEIKAWMDLPEHIEWTFAAIEEL